MTPVRARAKRKSEAIESASGPQPDALPSRKELILEAAQKHFVARGFEAASMRDIAADAGITIATLYFHVGTKEQLFLDVLDSQRLVFWDGLQAAIGAAGPLWRDRLEAAIRFHVTTRCAPDSGPLVRVGDAQRLSGEIHDRYMARRDEYEHVFRDLIAGGIAAGEFADIDEKVAAAGILGLGNTVALWYRPGRLSPDQIADQYVALLLSGLNRRTRYGS